MPIVDIEIVLQPHETISAETVSELADQLGEIFASPKNGTWVKLHEIAGDHYAENAGKEEEVYPVFVSVLKSQLPGPDEMQKEVETITKTLAQLCKRPASLVHVIYLPEGKGRIAFGGKIVT